MIMRIEHNRILGFLLVIMLGTIISAGPARGHEVVGEVTQLMLHMNHTLTFLKNGRGDKAVHMAEKVYEDFKDPMGEGEEAGLRTNSERVDGAFGTSSHEMIADAIKEQDPGKLRKGIELMSFLLMLEKFDVLQTTFEKKNANGGIRETIFWLGRNYFSYLLEPAMGEKDPIEEKRLSRLLDEMLYSIEDEEWDTFISLRRELTRGIVRFFDLPVSGLPVE